MRSKKEVIIIVAYLFIKMIYVNFSKSTLFWLRQNLLFSDPKFYDTGVKFTSNRRVTVNRPRIASC